MSATQTTYENAARVMSLLRHCELTRYQIEERLESCAWASSHAVNSLLESLIGSGLVGRDGIRYGLSKRGAASLDLIDKARPVHLIDPPAPQVDGEIPDHLQVLMKRSPSRRTASAASQRPSPRRLGSLQFLEAPSRHGDTLRYRDGRVTDMAGLPLPA